MRRSVLFLVILCAAVLARAQISVGGEAVVFGSHGVAGIDQAIDSGEPGAYAYEKNGFYVSSYLTFKGSLETKGDLVVRLLARGRTGSPYFEFQLAPASGQDVSLSVDCAYGKVNVFGSLGLSLPFDLNLSFGKYPVYAADYGGITRYGMDSALTMVKLANDFNLGLELRHDFLDGNLYTDLGFPYLSLQLYGGALSDEAIPRLYDTDGSVSSHGKVVIGEYAPQLLATLRLENYLLPLGLLSAEAVYTMNGAGIYSGNSLGASASLSLPLVPSRLNLPLGIEFAYHEKNVDALGASTGSGLLDSSTDFRGTMRAGFGAGIKYAVPYGSSAEASLGLSWTRVEHIYRDPVQFIGLSFDARYNPQNSFFVGGGVILGTLADVTWATRAGVPTLYDNYRHVFSLLQNFGLEAYAGMNVGQKSSVVIGANDNRGLAMNYGLESLRDGEVKFRQKGSTAGDGLYETFGVYVKAIYKL
jgi:hypothetical protein